MEGKARIEEALRLLGATNREARFVEQPELNEHARLIPIHMGDVRMLAHRRHGRLDVARVELGVAMGVELRPQALGV